jgi:DNA-binding response OmpR family regulator
MISEVHIFDVGVIEAVYPPKPGGYRVAKRKKVQMEKRAHPPCERPSTKMALVIEDDPSICELLASYLKQAGYYPLVFTDPEDVLTLLRSVVMEIIILDLILPGLDGVALVREIERRKLRTAPILVISTHEQSSSRAQDINAEGFMSKPFSFAKLIQLVDTLVKAHAAQRRIEHLL